MYTHTHTHTHTYTHTHQEVRRRTSNLLVAEGLSHLQGREFVDAIHLFTVALGKKIKK